MALAFSERSLFVNAAVCAWIGQRAFFCITHFEMNETEQKINLERGE